MSRVLQNVVPVGKRCPACEIHVTRQRDILPMRRVYLCESHRQLWDAADYREERASDRRYENEQAKLAEFLEQRDRESDPPEVA